MWRMSCGGAWLGFPWGWSGIFVFAFFDEGESERSRCGTLAVAAGAAVRWGELRTVRLCRCLRAFKRV